jgi:predicted kinase
MTINKVVEEFIEQCGKEHEAMLLADHGNLNKLNPYHMEGSVWTHTCMVTAVARAIREDDFYFQVATLFHDIGKPKVREIRPNGNVAFFNHEGVSTFMALDVIQKLNSLQNLSGDDIERILKIISLHGDFYGFSEFSEEKIIKTLSKRFIHNKPLFVDVMDHVHCDHGGRFFADRGRVFTEDLACKVLREINALEAAEYERHIDREFTMLIGAPCSGKSTWIENNVKEGDIVVSRDSIIMRETDAENKGLSYNDAYARADHKKVDGILSNEFFEASKKKDVHVYLDMTNMSRKRRRSWLNRLSKSTKTRGLVFIAGAKELHRRNKSRTNKVLDYKVLDRMMQNFIAPTYDEFHEIEWVIT